MNTDASAPPTPGVSAREHLLQSIWDHSLDALLLTAPDGRIFAANPAACNLFDRTEAEICRLGRNGLLDLSDPHLVQALAEREQTGQARRELAFLRPDGSRFYGEVTSAVFTDRDGQRKTSMIIRDITAHRALDERLQAMTLFPQYNPGPVLRVSLTGAVLVANLAAEAIGLRAGASLGEIIPLLQHLDLADHIQNGTRFEIEAPVCEKHFLFTLQGLPAAEAALLYGINITERKRAEAALRQSERKFRTIFELAPVGISLLNAARQITDCNPAVEKISGLTRADLLAGRHLQLQYIHGDGTPLTPDEFASARALREDRIIQDDEVGVVTQTGGKIWLLVSAAPLDPAGASALVIMQDITARKEAETALRENEQRLRVALSAPNVAVFNQDLALRYTWMFQPQLGYTVEQVVGKTDFDLLPPAAAAQAVQAKREAIAAGGVVRREVAVAWEGGVKSYDLVVEPLRDATGAVVGITGASFDITDRKQAEQALRESEARLQLVLAATADGVWDWDFRTDRAYLSPRYYEMTGYQPGEVVPDLEFYKRLVHPEDWPATWQAMEDHLQGRTTQSVFDYRMLRKDGSLLWVLGRGRVVERDAGGAPLRMVGTITDITARKQAEAELAASQTALRALMARLQAARESERQRIARLIHDDLGHTFTSLKLDLAWLDRRLAERKLTRRSALRRKLAAMGQQVEDSLHTARTLSTTLHPAVLDSLGFTAALEWAVQQFGEQTHIACQVALPAEPLTLDARRSAALFRALQELLANVAQHARATAVQVRVTLAAGWVQLEVVDNGRGITEQECSDPRALGLLGLRERAREFGGAAEIGRAPGGGTRASLRIPQTTP